MTISHSINISGNKNQDYWFVKKNDFLSVIKVLFLPILTRLTNEMIRLKTSKFEWTLGNIRIEKVTSASI